MDQRKDLQGVVHCTVRIINFDRFELELELEFGKTPILAR